MDDATTNEMVRAFLGGLVRHGLTTLGGMLASAGLISVDGEKAFVGAGMVFAGVAWSAWEKYGKVKALAAARRVMAKVTPK